MMTTSGRSPMKQVKNDHEPGYWAEAEAHLKAATMEYVALLVQPGVNVDFVLRITLAPLCQRFSSGERSVELHDEIMHVSL